MTNMRYADLENIKQLENNLCPGLGRCGANENISIKPKMFCIIDGIVVKRAFLSPK